MNTKGTRRLVTTTAILGVLAALLVAPANARFVDPDSGGSADAAASATGGSSLGLTGDSPLTRVSAPEPEGLTGDGALTRAGAHGTSDTSSSTNERDRTWIGIGSGGGALLLAAIAALYFSSRARERQVATP